MVVSPGTGNYKPKSKNSSDKPPTTIAKRDKEKEKDEMPAVGDPHAHMFTQMTEKAVTFDVQLMCPKQSQTAAMIQSFKI